MASYQPKTTVERQQQAATTAPASAVHSKRTTASALRKAAHAERDRSRLVDPGNLDLVTEVDEEEEEKKDKWAAVAQSVESGERGRNRALRILQARAELPEEGMWRSLAS